MTVIQYYRGNTFYIVMCISDIKFGPNYNSIDKIQFHKKFFCSFIKCSYFHTIPDMVFSWTIKENHYFKIYFRFDICIAQDTDHMEGNIGAAALLWSCNLTHDQMCILWLAEFSILFFLAIKLNLKRYKFILSKPIWAHL